MSKDSKTTSDKVPGVGDIAIEAIRAGKTNDEALEAVKEAHPDKKTTLQSINWYRGKLRAEGAKLKGSSKPIPTSRELKTKAKTQAVKDAKANGGTDPLS